MKLKLMIVALAAAGLAACGNEEATESKAPSQVSAVPAQPAEQPKVAEVKEAAPAAAAPAAQEEKKGDDQPAAEEKKPEEEKKSD